MPSFELAKSAFLSGLSLLEQQQFAQAEAAFRESLVHAPDRPSTLINLSITLINQQNFDEAKQLLEKLLHIEPDNPEAYFYLGLANNHLNLISDAIKYLDKATEMAPQFFDAWLLKADLFDTQQLPMKALTCYEALVAIKPDFLLAWKNMGFLLSELKQHEQAINAYSQALKLDSNDADIHFAKGNALSELGRSDEALSSLYRAIQLNPNHGKAHSICGIILSRQGLIEEALCSYQAALTVEPQDFQTWSNLGVTLHANNKPDEALVAYDKAVSINPQYAEAWSNKGIALNDLKRHEEALVAYDKAISINSKYAEAWSNKGITLNDLKRHEEALVTYDKATSIHENIDYLLGTRLHTQMQIADWVGLDQRLAILKEKLEQSLNVAPPFPLLSLIESPKLQQQAARSWIKKKAPVNSSLGPISRELKRGKIRLGYFSADFRIHPVALLMAGVFEHHDRSQFEVFGFSYGPKTNDEIRARLEKGFDQFIEVHDQTDQEVAKLARAHGIDIAIDLTGLTRFSRQGIFAHRAAPIQVNYLGYPGTSGAGYFDYCIADSTLIPEDEAQYYEEKIVYLPHTYQANDDKRAVSSKVFTREECGLPQDAFVFCCFNNNYKITPTIFAIWMNILQRVEKSVLWLFQDNPMAAKNLLSEAVKCGIPSDRIIFAKHMSPADHLARHRLADLFLDTLPYNAHTTASDALWSDLPIITVLGNAFPGRVAASLLKAIGLPELITQNPKEYEELAVSLATNPAALQQIKQKLIANKAKEPLFNTGLFTQNLEKVYATMYDHTFNSNPIEPIDIK
ncbi:glycosyltransferase family 41 protein [Polynucleobacter sp. AP-Titi-500A-B4]|uniref:tetratricopeptide repeat protein n=1 Tax=Polynucleobacter sp. AP-Titi-500A-B4 TaxID=2576923 RepID=UPI001BFE374D|nr:glycosyltransferase family 41 protein [Polynucleobacter sp. AP-Titi-500A-B4]QWE12813.1 tetratricopeptide repeat protein [Polynucleobacter sp. AP-Titi-500A-B4]